MICTVIFALTASLRASLAAAVASTSCAQLGIPQTQKHDTTSFAAFTKVGFG